MAHVDPATLAPQGNTVEAAAERRLVPLWLVIEDEMPPRKYATTADHAWAYRNDAYDHCAGAYETPSDSAGCYYTERPDEPGYVGDEHGSHR